MSYTFTLKGYNHVLSANYFPPIELDSRYDYAIGLVGLHTFNTIPNLIEKLNNKFYYDDKILSIPTGAYEVTDIEHFLQNSLADANSNQKELNEVISLKPNQNTLKCVLKSRYKINFQPKDSIGRLLGFSDRILEPNVTYQSDLPVQIINVTTIRVECNITSGAFYEGATAHTLYEFAPCVDPGFSINIEPSNIIYLPVNVRTVNNITLTLLDQDGNPVNFMNEAVILRLHLKKLIPSWL
jgi:hypothetical protein